MKDPHTFFILYLMDAKMELILQLSIFSWATEFSIFYSNDRMVAGKMSTLPLLTLYTLTSVCIFSILFSIHFQRGWQGEFV